MILVVGIEWGGVGECECYQSVTAHQHQKGSYRAKTGDNDCNVNSSRYSLSTALCESSRYQAKSEQNVRQDLIPRVRHGEAALCTPGSGGDEISIMRMFITHVISIEQKCMFLKC